MDKPDIMKFWLLSLFLPWRSRSISPQNNKVLNQAFFCIFHNNDDNNNSNNNNSNNDNNDNNNDSNDDDNDNNNNNNNSNSNNNNNDNNNDNSSDMANYPWLQKHAKCLVRRHFSPNALLFTPIFVYLICTWKHPCDQSAEHDHTERMVHQNDYDKTGISNMWPVGTILTSQDIIEHIQAQW